jgi:N-methylhydantoinase A
MLSVDLRHDFERFHESLREQLDINEVKRLYDEMESEARTLENKEKMSRDKRILMYSLRARYWGQFRHVVASWPGNEALSQDTIAQGITNFHDKHHELFGYSNKDYPVEILGFGLTMIGKLPAPTLPELNKGVKEAPTEASKGIRDVYFEETNGFVKARIYDGDKLLCGNQLQGPCIVEHPETTVVVPPDFKIVVDQYGNYRYPSE